MECPRRRMVATFLTSVFGLAGAMAQDAPVTPPPNKLPMVMPPKAGPPVTVTVSPPSSPLPATGIPLGTPIPVGIPAGTQVRTIPNPIATTSVTPPAFATEGVVISSAPSPYFGYYPTQWRAFPDLPYPQQSQQMFTAHGQPPVVYPPITTNHESQPPLLRNNPQPMVTPPTIPTPHALPVNVQTPPPVNAGQVRQPGLLPFEQVQHLPPLLPSVDLTQQPVVRPELRPAAALGRPRVMETPAETPPQPFPIAPAPGTAAPAVSDILPIGNLEPAAANPVPAPPPLTVRPPVAPERPKFAQEDIFRPAAPVIAPQK